MKKLAVLLLLSGCSETVLEATDCYKFNPTLDITAYELAVFIQHAKGQTNFENINKTRAAPFYRLDKYFEFKHSGWCK